MSAHRTPAVVRQSASSAAARGWKVVIAAAGGAAHLAGVVASHTILPVIGIPVATDLAGSGVTLFLVEGDDPGLTVKQIPTIGMDNTCEVILKDVDVNTCSICRRAV